MDDIIENTEFVLSRYDKHNDLHNDLVKKCGEYIILLNKDKQHSFYAYISKTCVIYIVFRLTNFKAGCDCGCVQGGSLFRDMADFLKTSIVKVGDKIKTIAKVVSNIPTALKGPRKNYPPFFRKFKKKYGDIKIKSITVCKKPIEKTFDSIINLVSLGQFQKNKDKLNYDDMFHLYLLLELENGKLVRLEKNQVMNIGFTKKPSKSTACENVDIEGRDISINSLLDIAQKNIGDNFYLYDGEDNNCQIFVNNVLKYSDILTPRLNKFIMQDTKKIIGQLPSLSKKIIKGTTNLAGLFDVLLHGARLFRKY